MSDKFIWTKDDTSLLLSLWSDRSVQQNFEETPRNVAIWYGIARYMRRRGIDVTWLQCRQRIKRLLGRYHKIKRGAKLNLKNVADSFYQELDLVFKQNRGTNLKPDSSVHSSSVDVSNEATTAVETLLTEPQFVNIEIHSQPLEIKECENNEDLKSSTPKIEPSRPIRSRKPSTRYMAEPSRPRPAPYTMPRPRPQPKPTSEECVYEIDPSESTSNVNPVKVAFKTKNGPVLGNQDAEHLDSRPGMPVWYAYANAADSDNPIRSGVEEKDQNSVVKQAIANESETTTKMLLAQAETTRRLLEANRTQQERLESRMDQIVGQLEQMVPVSNQGITKKLETKLNNVLNKLDQIIPHTNVQTSEQTLHRKIEVVLERLEYIIPFIEQYSLSGPNLVDKIDSLLTGIDKIAPYACNLIEVNTEEYL